MSDKHTPRTDEQAFVVYPYQIHGQIVGNKAVTVEFARQLETELNEANRLIEKLAGAINDAVSNGGMCDYNDEILREALKTYEESK